MGGFSINSRTIAIVGLIIASVLFAYSRMPGGIGGTGVTGVPGGIGGTGIYGRIDGFGSIWVNGVEIFYDEDQNIVRHGRDGLPSDLKIGQIVAVIIDEETGRAEAQSIEIIEEVNGPIEMIDEDQLMILGQKVVITDDTIIEGMLEIGKQMAVNGFRTPDGSILASRIDAPLIEGEVSLRGSVTRAENDRYWINDQELEIDGETIIIGNTIEVRGRLGAERRRFIIENIKKRRLPFDRHPSRISYQGAFDDIPALDMAKPALQEIETSVIEFKPELDDGIIRIPRPNLQNRAEFRNRFKRERIANEIIERRNEARVAARNEAEKEARRQAEVVARRQAEVEARRQAEIEARKLAEAEMRRQVDAEARRRAELAAERQAELEARRQVEIDARRQTELEVRRQAQFEALRQVQINFRKEILPSSKALREQRQTQFETLRQIQSETRREPLQPSSEINDRRAAQLDALQQLRSEARSETEKETIRQFEGELRRQTDEEILRELRGQVRTQTREELREVLRLELRQRLRRQLRRNLQQ